ncbi:MAG: calcium-binding protein, partial [Hoeflea sp.]|uniref:calcium-binding protein n=1 Tax=Hoeflea sp. TaxID=1940281 RepID=UPI003299C90E
MALIEWLGDFQVNVVDSVGSDNSQYDTQVIQLTNGNILVAWTSNADPAGGPGSGSFNDVIGRIYDPLGNAVTGEIALNSLTSENEQRVSIAAIEGGGFTVGYQRFDPSLSTPKWGLNLASFNASGVQQNSTTLKTMSAVTEWQSVKVAVNSPTEAIAVYTEEGGDIFAQRYNPTTSALIGSQITVQTQDPFSDNGFDVIASPLIDMYGIVYADRDSNPDNDQLYFEAFATTGGQIGSRILIDESFDDASDPSIATLDNGKFIISWNIDGSGGTDSGIRFSIVDALAGGAGPMLNPMTTVAGNQFSSEVVAIDDNQFVIAWYDENTHDIRAQRFDDDGVKIDGEVVIQSYTTWTASDISMTRLEDGRISIGWTQNSGSDTDVRMAIWDPRDDANQAPVYSNGQIIGTPGADTLNPVPEGAQEVFGWNGNDTFWVTPNNSGSNGTLLGVDYDGGNGTDTLGLLSPGSYSALASDLVSLEILKFNAGSTSGFRGITLYADQAEMFTTFDFAQGGAARPDLLTILLSPNEEINLFGKTIVDFETEFDDIAILGNSGAELIRGTPTDDIIQGGLGIDEMYGGGGSDTLALTNSGYSGTVTVDLTAGTIISTQGTEIAVNFENVNGSDADETILGLDSTSELNEIRAGNGNGNGNDTIDGGTGNDKLYGEGGQDRFLLGHLDLQPLVSKFTPAEIIHGGTGTDTIEFRGGTGSVTHDLRGHDLTSIEELEFGSGDTADIDRTVQLYANQFGAGVSLTALIDGLFSPDDREILEVFMSDVTVLDLSGLTFAQWGAQGEFTRIIGDNSAEIITGTTQNDIIDTGGGNDIVYAEGGSADIVTTGSGNDQVFISALGDTVDTGDDDDTIHVATFSLTAAHSIDGGNGIDTLNFGTVANHYSVNLATGSWTRINDTANVAALFRIENMIAGSGNDILVGSTVANVITGGDGNDFIDGGGGNDTLAGGDGADTLEGGDGNDLLFGGTGADQLIGGAGDDKLYVVGNDSLLRGDAGHDQVIVLDTGGVNITIGSGVENVSGNSGNDVINAGGTTTAIIIGGGGGVDTLTGGSVADTLAGGDGN